jgi:hypothetical protein
VHVAADSDVKLVLRQAGLYKIPLREEKILFDTTSGKGNIGKSVSRGEGITV